MDIFRLNVLISAIDLLPGHQQARWPLSSVCRFAKEHKLIRRYAVTDASVRDSQMLDEVLGEENSGRLAWADSVCRSEAREE